MQGISFIILWVHKHPTTQAHVHNLAQHTLWVCDVYIYESLCFDQCNVSDFLSRVYSSQSDLGETVLRTVKQLSYYISSALLAGAPQSPDLTPDCTNQTRHCFILPTSICCHSSQRRGHTLVYPSTCVCTFTFSAFTRCLYLRDIFEPIVAI